MSNNRIIDIPRYAEIFKALSNPCRLTIFLRLVECYAPGTNICGSEGTCECIGELGKDLGIVPSTVSHHIKELHRAGLIQSQRRGQSIECWVSPEVLHELAGFFMVDEKK